MTEKRVLEGPVGFIEQVFLPNLKQEKQILNMSDYKLASTNFISSHIEII